MYMYPWERIWLLIWLSTFLISNGVCDAKLPSHSAQGILIGAIAGGSMLVIVIVGACSFCIYRKKKKRMQKYDDKRHTISKSKYTEKPQCCVQMENSYFRKGFEITTRWLEIQQNHSKMKWASSMQTHKQTAYSYILCSSDSETYIIYCII